jgi:catechol 2,3-dioxygenase
VKIDRLGHVIIKVRDVKRAEGFYHGLLGLPIQARSRSEKLTFFTLGQHHDFGVMEVGADAPAAESGAVGTHHFAFRLAGGLDALREAKAKLEAAGVKVAPVDHVVTKSLYFGDPDGNAVELFVDGEAVWRDDPDTVFRAGPLTL